MDPGVRDGSLTRPAPRSGPRRKAATLLQSGRAAQAQRLLPPERAYPLPRELERRLRTAAR
ncbi:hypothetical protein [Streptomyces buecherae]|uniref:hypothetical protein n=1 Tax=Streptomyces buecherae TaxID=2763006 RepID=UPI001C259982|nr:hypothetical protein [Streptomyces buecherae]